MVAHHGLELCRSWCLLYDEIKRQLQRLWDIPYPVGCPTVQPFPTGYPTEHPIHSPMGCPIVPWLVPY